MFSIKCNWKRIINPETMSTDRIFFAMQYSAYVCNCSVEVRDREWTCVARTQLGTWPTGCFLTNNINPSGVSDQQFC